MSPGAHDIEAMLAEGENARAQQDVHLVIAGHARPHLPNEFCESSQLASVKAASSSATGRWVETL